MAGMNRLPAPDSASYPRMAALWLLLLFSLWSGVNLLQSPIQAQRALTVTCALEPASLSAGQESRWSLMLDGVDGSPLQSMEFVINYPADALTFADSAPQSQGINLDLTQAALEILGPLEITQNQVDPDAGQIRFTATRQLAVSIAITESSPFTNTAFPLAQIDLTAQEEGLATFSFQRVVLQDEGGNALDVRVDPCLLAVDVPLPTSTPTISPLATSTPTISPPPTSTPTISPLPTATISPLPTPTWTFTPVSPLATPFPTPTPTWTWTPTWTPTATETWTPTFTPTPTVVVISTPTPRTGQQQSPLSTPPVSPLEMPTATTTDTPTPTVTPFEEEVAEETPEPVDEPTPAPTLAPAITATPTPTPTATPTVMINLTPIPGADGALVPQTGPAPSVPLITDSLGFLILGWITLIGGLLILLLIWILRRT